MSPSFCSTQHVSLVTLSLTVLSMVEGTLRKGAIELMSDHEFSLFVLLICIIGAIGSGVLVRLFKNCTMSQDEVRKKMQENDVYEMQSLINERQYNGRIFLPTG